MFSFFSTGHCPIGIDVGSHAVRLAQFQAQADGLRLQAACRIELDSLDGGADGPARLAAALRHARASHDFHGRRVVLSLPMSALQAKSVRLPPMPDSDLQQALQWEAKDRFGFDVGENAGQLVWFRAGEVRRGTEVKDELLLFAVEGGRLNDYIQCVTDQGLRLHAIDLSPCAIYRALRRTVVDPAAPGAAISAILDIGHAGSQFFILRGGDLAFYKYVDIGGKTINQAVADKLEITPAEALQMRARMAAAVAGASATPAAPAGLTQTGAAAMAGDAAGEAAPLAEALAAAVRAPVEELARELDMCMRYFVVTFRGARPESIAVTGRQASSPVLLEILAAALGLPVEEAQPLRGIQDLGDVARPDRSGEWAVAAGLSLYPLAARAALEAA